MRGDGPVSETVEVGMTWQSREGVKKIEKIEGGKAYISKDGKTTFMEILPVGEIEDEKTRDEKNLASRKATQDKAAADKAQDDARHAKEYKYLQPYLDSIGSPMRRAKIEKALRRSMTVGGKGSTLAATHHHVEQWVKDGYKPDPAKKRMVKGDSFYTAKTKAELDYAAWLVRKNVKITEAMDPKVKAQLLKNPDLVYDPKWLAATYPVEKLKSALASDEHSRKLWGGKADARFSKSIKAIKAALKLKGVDEVTEAMSQGYWFNAQTGDVIDVEDDASLQYGSHTDYLKAHPDEFGLDERTLKANSGSDRVEDKRLLKYMADRTPWVRVQVAADTLFMAARNDADARKAVREFKDYATTALVEIGRQVRGLDGPGAMRRYVSTGKVDEMSDDTGAHTQPGDVIHFTTSGGRKRRAHAKKVLKNGVVIAGGEVIPFDAIHYVDASRTERTTNERTGDARDYGVGPDRDAAVPVASRSYKGDPADVEAPAGGDEPDADAPPEDDEDTAGPKSKEELIGFSLREVQAYFDLIVAKGSTFAVALKETKDKFKIKGLKVSPIGRIIPVEGLPRGKSPKASAPPPMEPGGDVPPDDGGDGGEEPVPPDDGSGGVTVPPDDGGDAA